MFVGGECGRNRLIIIESERKKGKMNGWKRVWCLGGRDGGGGGD